jgi:hypothetical protein
LEPPLLVDGDRPAVAAGQGSTRTPAEVTSGKRQRIVTSTDSLGYQFSVLPRTSWYLIHENLHNEAFANMWLALPTMMETPVRGYIQQFVSWRLSILNAWETLSDPDWAPQYGPPASPPNPEVVRPPDAATPDQRPDEGIASATPAATGAGAGALAHSHSDGCLAPAAPVVAVVGAGAIAYSHLSNRGFTPAAPAAAAAGADALARDHYDEGLASAASAAPAADTGTLSHSSNLRRRTVVTDVSSRGPSTP